MPSSVTSSVLAAAATILAFGVIPSSLTAQTAESAASCEHLGERSNGQIAAVSNVRLERGPLDRQGPRIVGCLHNLGDETLENLSLGYQSIQTRGAGSGSIPLTFAPIPPGGSGPFISGEFTRDAAHYEQWGTTGIRVRELEVFMDGQYPLDTPIELPLPLLDRPAHAAEETCSSLVEVSGEGTIHLRALAFAHVGPPGARSSHLIGCVTNTGDQTLAEGSRPSIDVTYSLRYGLGAGREGQFGQGGGSGSLQLEGPLAPGETAFFVSNFSFTHAELQLELEPGGMGVVDGYYQFVPRGPRVTLERSGFEP